MSQGTDPSNHFYGPESGAGVLIDNALRFAAAGNDTQSGTHETGFYMAMAYYYEQSITPENGYVELVSFSPSLKTCTE